MNVTAPICDESTASLSAPLPIIRLAPLSVRSWQDDALFQLLNQSVPRSPHARIAKAIDLLDKGAGLNTIFTGHRTALAHAIGVEKFELAHLFVDRGANTHVPDENHRTALHEAAGRGCDDLVQRLLQIQLDAGLPIDVPDKNGCTPLHLAASWKDNASTCALLLDHGADIHKMNVKGQTPLHVAAAAGQPGVFWLLLDRGANHERLDFDGRTPVMAAQAAPGIPAVVQDLEAMIQSRLAMAAVNRVLKTASSNRFST